jgi:hypothetical protein
MVSVSARRLSAIINDYGSQAAIETSTTTSYGFLAVPGAHILDRFFGRRGSVGHNISFSTTVGAVVTSAEECERLPPVCMLPNRSFRGSYIASRPSASP